jgi:hypothetical protein
VPCRSVMLVAVTVVARGVTPDPFEKRIETIRSVIRRMGVTHVVAVQHTKLIDVAHLDRELATVEKLGGEGLMLREPGSRCCVVLCCVVLCVLCCVVLCCVVLCCVVLCCVVLCCVACAVRCACAVV